VQVLPALVVGQVAGEPALGRLDELVEVEHPDAYGAGRATDVRPDCVP
jgi:hypothetical protein